MKYAVQKWRTKLKFNYVSRTILPEGAQMKKIYICNWLLTITINRFSFKER
jgi:hypothetical protein